MDKSWGSKSDPFIVVYEMVGKEKKLIGKTECQKDQLNPEFVVGVEAQYFFEKKQTFYADIYDADDLTQ